MADVTFSPGARTRLTKHDAGRFAGDTLFDRVGRTLCGIGKLPRKELYETWEVARRVRRLYRGGRVVDVAGGHGLLAHLMLLLDDSSHSAVIVDPQPPPSAALLRDAFAAEWPRLAGRIEKVALGIESARIEATDVVVSSHACGALTDAVLDAAASAGARVAVLPCCHDLETCDTGPLDGWMDGPLAIDVMPAAKLEARGYRVRTQTIPAAITPKNRLLLGDPLAADRS